MKPRLWCRKPIPVGEVRIHGGVRRIKLRLDGPKSRRWMDYARWWWLQNKGPIPEGKRIIHEDGDTLNDDPANLFMGDAADVVALWHDRDPAGSDANYRALAAVTVERNRITAAINRLSTVLRSRWYGVDHDRRLIFNQPRRQRWQVYRDFGLPVSAADWRRIEGLSLGWPRLRSMPACILSILIEAGPLRSLDLRQRVTALRKIHGWTPFALNRDELYQSIGDLRLRGWIETTATKGRRRTYIATEDAIGARGPQSPIIPMWGDDLGWPPFDTFTLTPFTPSPSTPATAGERTPTHV